VGWVGWEALLAETTNLSHQELQEKWDNSLADLPGALPGSAPTASRELAGRPQPIQN
jgi:hypothetical protein